MTDTPCKAVEGRDVDALANEIRRVDGANALGAGALAEALMPFLAAPSAAPASAGADLEAIETYYARQIEWSRETFGPALRTKGVIEHIRKELREIEDDPHDLSEWVDVIILAMDGFWRHGGTAETLMPILLAKQAKNMARTWPDWRTRSEDQAIEHDRSGDALDLAAPSPATQEPVAFQPRPLKPVGEEADRYRDERGPEWRKIFDALRDYRMSNMTMEGDPSWVYPLVDLMSRDGSGVSIDDGEWEMVALADEISIALAPATPSPDARLLRLHGVSLAVAQQLVSLFGGEETDMTVEFIKDGHSGPGFYAWCTEYPEDGSDFLGAPSEFSYLAALAASPGAQDEEGGRDA